MRPFEYLAILVLLSVGELCIAENPTAGKQVEQEFVAKDNGRVGYLLYLPKDFKAGESQPPLMMFLHGRGESNGPLSKVATWGPPMLAQQGESFPYVIVSPQCPASDNWISVTQQTRVLELLDDVTKKFNVDRNRVYLTGLSMGASGSWRMSADHSQRFAAVVPICGRGDTKDATAYVGIPMWVFVGDQDRVFDNNTSLFGAIRDAGGNAIRLTTLENIGHNSWSAAYASPDLYTWLNKQSLSNRSADSSQKAK